MTTLQMQRSLHLDLPTVEDPMELSSEIDRPSNQSEDIDIDLDPAPQEGEDEYMGEDFEDPPDQGHLENQLASAGNDDLMDDDESPNYVIGEEASVHDEDLQDVESGLGDFEDTLLENPQVPPYETPNAQFESEKQGIETRHEDFGEFEQHSFALGDPDHDAEARAGGQKEQTSPQNASDTVTLGLPQQGEDASEVFEDESPLQETSEEISATQALVEDQTKLLENATHQYEEPNVPKQNPEEPTSEVVAPSFAELKDSSTLESSYIHSVIVIYQDNEMSLFPPYSETQQDTQTFLLQDEHLARESIQDLLGACRTVLGDSIRDQDDLEISINELDLHISECGVEASNTTLVQIIDIYMHLQECDDVTDPPPLYINLYTRTKFSHRLDFLFNCIEEGKGLVHIRTIEAAEEPEAQEINGEDEFEATFETPSDQQTRDEHSRNTNDAVVELKTTEVSEFPVTDTSGKTGKEGTVPSEITEGYLTTGQKQPELERSLPSDVQEQSSKSQTLSHFKSAEGPRSPASNLEPSRGVEVGVAEEGDLIDYNEEDGSAQDSSIGSSTVQGNALNSDSNEIPAPLLDTVSSEPTIEDSQKSVNASPKYIAPTANVSSEIEALPKAAKGDIYHEELEDTDSRIDTGESSTRLDIQAGRTEQSFRERETQKEDPSDVLALHDNEKFITSPFGFSQPQYDVGHIEDEDFIPFDEEVTQGYDASPELEDHGSEENLEPDPKESANEKIQPQEGTISTEGSPGEIDEDNNEFPPEHSDVLDFGDALGETGVDLPSAGNDQTDPDLQGPTLSQWDSKSLPGEPEDNLDEITYEDEEEFAKVSTVELNAESSPNSLKRSRSDTNLDANETEAQDIKRVRSS